MTKKKKAKAARSAKTGEFVSLEKAKRAPDTTVVETFFRPDPKIIRKKKDKKWSRGR